MQQQRTDVLAAGTFAVSLKGQVQLALTKLPFWRSHACVR